MLLKNLKRAHESHPNLVDAPLPHLPGQPEYKIVTVAATVLAGVDTTGYPFVNDWRPGPCWVTMRLETNSSGIKGISTYVNGQRVSWGHEGDASWRREIVTVTWVQRLAKAGYAPRLQGLVYQPWGLHGGKRERLLLAAIPSKPEMLIVPAKLYGKTEKDFEAMYEKFRARLGVTEDGPSSTQEPPKPNVDYGPPTVPNS